MSQIKSGPDNPHLAELVTEREQLRRKLIDMGNERDRVTREVRGLRSELQDLRAEVLRIQAARGPGASGPLPPLREEEFHGLPDLQSGAVMAPARQRLARTVDVPTAVLRGGDGSGGVRVAARAAEADAPLAPLDLPETAPMPAGEPEPEPARRGRREPSAHMDVPRTREPSVRMDAPRTREPSVRMDVPRVREDSVRMGAPRPREPSVRMGAPRQREHAARAGDAWTDAAGWEAAAALTGSEREWRRELSPAQGAQLSRRLTHEEYEQLPFGLLTLDAGGRVLGYQDAEQQLAAVTREGMRGLNFFTQVAPCAPLRDFAAGFTELCADPTRVFVRTFDFLCSLPQGEHHISVILSPARQPGLYHVAISRRLVLPR